MRFLSCALAVALAGTLPHPLSAQGLPSTAGGIEAFEILKEAIEVPTVAGRGQVPVLADTLARRLVAGGFAVEDLRFVPMGETGYFVARYPGRDPGAAPAVILGHLDVVEASAEDWERDPFVAVVEDGFVFGRGSSDNKADIAMSMAAVLGLKREGWVPARNVLLAFTGDEETQMATTAAMTEELAGAWMVLNGDAGGGKLDPEGRPEVYMVQAGEKTYADIRLTLTDPGGHSSRPGPTNAIAAMSEALAQISAYRFPPQVSPLTRAFWEGTAPSVSAELGAAMRALAADPANAEAAELLSARPDYIGVVRTTCVPTMVSGGHAPNALPQSVTANVNCRIFPGDPIQATVETLRGVVTNPAIGFELIDSGAVEAPESPLRDDLMAALRAAVHERAPGLAIVPFMSTGATDSSHFRVRGVPAFGVSATFLRPEDDFAHGLNERVPLATLDPGVRQWQTLLRELLN
jgi:carboxypeptidase PM20D1